ncbi:hypothetical protein NCER_101418 [Vairimorpha ceranae BRL01]|uniref:RRM domain-containing protein n=1 Tax=Vairimorpha ceranae (strain BRL01) TaxID=578460 RepID=C4V9Z3_VAIC1|nr:hypothetical protein NCER_101418 [Vairimorpha ceranae BRL01]
MKLFIGRIPRELDADIIYNYFKAYGEIDSYNFKGQYAFVEFKNDRDAENILNTRDIEINGHRVVVEASNSKGKFQGEHKRQEFHFNSLSERPDSNNVDYQSSRRSPRYDDRRSPRYDDRRSPRYDDRRSPRYDDRRNERYGNRRSPRYDDRRSPRYDDRRNSQYNENFYRHHNDFRSNSDYPPRQQYSRDYDYRAIDQNFDRNGYSSKESSRFEYDKHYLQSDRERCSYCSRCEIHGNLRFPKEDPYEHKKIKREHPNDINKLVIQNLPQNVSLHDIDDFVKQTGLESVFSRLTKKGDAAIVEFKDIQSRDDAISKLEGKDLKGTPVYVREFKVGSNFQRSINSLADRDISPIQNDYKKNVSGDNDDSQGVDIYSGLDK